MFYFVKRPVPYCTVATYFPTSRSLAEAPLVIPSSMVFYTQLPNILQIRNPVLLRDVVAVLHHVDKQRRNRLNDLLTTK